MDVYTLTFGRIKCRIISIQSNVFVVKVSITQAPPPYVSQKTTQMIQPVFTAVKITNHPNVPQKKIKSHTNALIAYEALTCPSKIGLALIALQVKTVQYSSRKSKS